MFLHASTAFPAFPGCALNIPVSPLQETKCGSRIAYFTMERPLGDGALDDDVDEAFGLKKSLPSFTSSICSSDTEGPLRPGSLGYAPSSDDDKSLDGSDGY